MAIDAFASERHLIDHLLPVWDALPQPQRGAFLVDPAAAGYAAALGIEATVCARLRLPPSDQPVLTAGVRDTKIAGRRPVVLLEHGAGQHYSNDHGSYAGGVGREHVVLFLTPNETVAERNRAAYPRAMHAVVGCPKLDRYAGWTPHGTEISVSFHWDCKTAPEAGSAWRWYARALPELVVRFGGIMGHAHPRMWQTVAPAYEHIGIEQVPDFAEVLERSRIYVVDNSSTGWEAMALGIPVVWMNAPRWRRDVEHGLRFWASADAGVQVDEPDELVAGIERALMDPPDIAVRRAEVSAEIYGDIDGKAARRAAEAIEHIL